jgi:aarF domain-containing kinase
MLGRRSLLLSKRILDGLGGRYGHEVVGLSSKRVGTNIAWANSHSSGSGKKVASIVHGARGYKSFAALGVGVGGVAGTLYLYSTSDEYAQARDRRRAYLCLESHSTSVDEKVRPFGSRLLEQGKHQILLAKRFVELSFLFFPVVVLSPICFFMGDYWKDRWFILLKKTLEKAGPAFLKWGQWAATRPDLFSPDVCRTFQLLQTDAPKHDFEYTKKVVESSLGRPLDEIFLEFESVPVASGSIAQVHRAVLSREGAQQAIFEEQERTLLSQIWASDRHKRELTAFSEGSSVAVKVRHPGVSELIDMDFELMHGLVWLAEKASKLVQGKNNLFTAQLKESLMQFGAPMKEQLDLRSEAAHLDDFAENFKWWRQVRFPLPAIGMATEDVLVETFENGDHISSYIGGESPYNHKLADLGLTCYLKMLLNDNFIHADLHPGNILVHLDKPSKGTLLHFLSEKTGWNIEIPRIVLLDVGMTARLSDREQGNLVSFFQSLTSLDGQGIAESILSFAEAVDDATGFKNEMNALFAALEPEQLRKNTHEVVSNMMDALREHGVQIPGVVSTVVITTMVLEGWSSKLNPDIRILDRLKDMLPPSWNIRMQKAVDDVLQNNALALA